MKRNRSKMLTLVFILVLSFATTACSNQKYEEALRQKIKAEVKAEIEAEEQHFDGKAFNKVSTHIMDLYYGARTYC